MTIEGQAWFLAQSLPVPSVSSTGDTQEDWERETICWQERGEGGGREAESYDRKKAWSSINHSILSGWKEPCGILSCLHALVQELMAFFCRLLMLFCISYSSFFTHDRSLYTTQTLAQSCIPHYPSYLLLLGLYRQHIEKWIQPHHFCPIRFWIKARGSDPGSEPLPRLKYTGRLWIKIFL